MDALLKHYGTPKVATLVIGLCLMSFWVGFVCGYIAHRL